MKKEDTVVLDAIKIRLGDQWLWFKPSEAKRLKDELDKIFGRESLEPIYNDGILEGDSENELRIDPNAEPMPVNWLIRFGVLRQNSYLEITT